MSRILLIASPLQAHFNARYALIQELAAAGHQLGAVFVAGDVKPDAVSRLAALGVEHVPFAGHRAIATSAEGARKLSVGTQGAAERAQRYRSLFIDRDDVDTYRASIRAFAPDVIAADPLDYDSIIAAELEGIPHVNIHAGLGLAVPRDIPCGLAEAEAALADARADKFARFGLPPRDFRYMAEVSPYLNIVWATRALVGDDADAAPNTELVGPCIPRNEHFDEPHNFDWSVLSTTKPVVYVTAGTSYYWQPDYFHTLAVAGAELGVQMVFAVMGLDATAAGYPGDVVVVRYVPQLGLMPRLAACVSHGGAVTLMDSMYFGVPCLIVPFASDQAIQGHVAARAGVGVCVPPAELSVATAAAALERALAPAGSLRGSVAQVKASYRASPGAVRAAERLAALV